MNKDQKFYLVAMCIGILLFLCFWMFIRSFFHTNQWHSSLGSSSQKALRLNRTTSRIPQLFEIRLQGPSLHWSAYRLDGVDGAMPTHTNELGLASFFEFGPAKSIPLVGDFNGDGTLDFASFSSALQHTSTGDYHMWSVAYSSPDLNAPEMARPKPAIERMFGEEAEVPLPGDFDGDGKQDLAVYNTAHFIWRVAFSSADYDIAKALAPAENGSVTDGGFHLGWGAPHMIPLTGDFDGDGITDIALWGYPETKDKEAEMKASSTPELTICYLPKKGGKLRIGKPTVFGSAHEVAVPEGSVPDIPLTGDIDCDGKDDFILFNKSSGHWQMRLSKLGKRELTWGLPPSEPLIQDFDGDGCSDLGLYSRESSYCYQFLPSSLITENFQQIAWENSILTRISWCHSNYEPIEVVRRKYIFTRIIPLNPGL